MRDVFFINGNRLKNYEEDVHSILMNFLQEYHIRYNGRTVHYDEKEPHITLSYTIKINIEYELYIDLYMNHFIVKSYLNKSSSINWSYKYSDIIYLCNDIINKLTYNTNLSRLKATIYKLNMDLFKFANEKNYKYASNIIKLDKKNDFVCSFNNNKFEFQFSNIGVGIYSLTERKSIYTYPDYENYLSVFDVIEESMNDIERR